MITKNAEAETTQLPYPFQLFPNNRYIKGSSNKLYFLLNKEYLHSQFSKEMCNRKLEGKI